jgi:hypothetical protein
MDLFFSQTLPGDILPTYTMHFNENLALMRKSYNWPLTFSFNEIKKANNNQVKAKVKL